MTGEFDLIEKLVADWRRGVDVRVGPGDDASGIGLGTSEDRLLLQTIDLLVEGVHFRKNWGSPFQLGWKSLAINLSDIAAMGGKPTHTHLALAIPVTWSEAEILEFMSGFKSLADRYQISLLGGDLSRSDESLMIAGTANGTVASDQVILRKGARVGDVIWVSGELGNAAGGLKLLKDGIVEEGATELLNAFLQPQPEVELGMLCSACGLIHAMIDLSDGLAGDLRHVLGASSVGATLEKEKIPVGKALAGTAEQRHWDALEMSLYGGEDYRLLGCTARENFDAFCDLVKQQLSRMVFSIGYISQNPGLRLQHHDGRCEEIPARAYDHFQSDNLT